MRTLAHLSDIHFGKIDLAIAEAVRARLAEVKPEITVVSGDFTQRARAEQFREARRFLDSLPGEKLVVPGNHDVPLWNLAARFLFPLHNYRKFITTDLTPLLHDEEVVIVGINTARSFTQANGRLSKRQVEHACRDLARFDGCVMKIVVTHHPLDLAAEFGTGSLVGRARMAMTRLASAGADVFLAGHHHHAYTGGTAHRYPIEGYSALIVQAGTATSTRLRGSPNSFNILRIEPPAVTVECHTWQSAAQRFEVLETTRYERRAGTGFVRLES